MATIRVPKSTIQKAGGGNRSSGAETTNLTVFNPEGMPVSAKSPAGNPLLKVFNENQIANPVITATSPAATYTPNSLSVSKASSNPSINPAYIAGGIAAAGLGAAALERRQDNPKHTPSMIENVGSSIVGVMDGVAGGVGMVLGLSGMPLMVGMLGGQLVSGAANRLIIGMHPETGERLALNTTTKRVAAKVDDAINAKFSDIVSPKLGTALANKAEAAIKYSAPALNTMSRVPGLSGLHADHLKHAPKMLGETQILHGAMRGTWLAGAGLGVYAAARSVPAQVFALRQLYADMTNQNVDNVSTFTLLTASNLPKPVLEARSKILAISGTHLISAIAGLTMAIKMNKIDQVMGNVFQKVGLGRLGAVGGGLASMVLMQQAYSIPETLSEYVEGFVGAPSLEYYIPLSQAQKAGQQLPVEELSAYILALNTSLHDPKHSGRKKFAGELAEQYRAEGTSMAEIANEYADGRQQLRLNTIQAQHAKTAPAASAPTEMSHAERIKNQRQAASPMMQKKMTEAELSHAEKLQANRQLAATAAPTQAI